MLARLNHHEIERLRHLFVKALDHARADGAAQERGLREALAEIMALIDEGWLVRNTVNDAHLPSYLRESARLVKALAAAQAALTPTEEAP